MNVETLEDRTVPASFTAGDLVILRMGDGVNTPTNAATTGSIIELTTTGANPAGGANVINIPAPATINGGGVSFIGNGTVAHGLELSQNGQYVTTIGYDAPVGTATSGTSSATPAATHRNVAQIDGNGSVTIPVQNTDMTGAVRDAVTSDGTQYWLIGANGERYVSSATPTTSVSVSTSNGRTGQIVAGNFVFDQQAVVNRFAGLPTTTGQTSLGIAPTDAGQFVFLDRQAGVGDPALGGSVDTLYVANGTSNNVSKFFWDGSIWTLASSTAAQVGSNYFGMTGAVSGASANLFLTTNSVTTSNLQSFVDTAAYNLPIVGTFTTLASAGTGYTFRGIAFAPQSASTAPVVASPPTATSVESTTATLNGSVTSDGGSPITARGIVYSATNTNPTVGDPNSTNLSASGTTGALGVNATNLTPNTLYYFATYASNSLGTTYSAAVGQFTTLLTSTTATSVVGAPLSPQQVGTSVTFTATVTHSPSVGTVTFYAGPGLTNQIGSPVNVVNGVAVSSATTTLPVGTDTISAVYSGDTGFSASTGTIDYTITAAAIANTATTVSGSPAGAQIFGTNITFTATVTNTDVPANTPSGTVNFFDGATQIGSATLNGSGIATLATAALGVGTHSITATLVGNTSFATSTGSTSQAINYVPGELVVTRVGTGTGALAATTTATFIDNITTGGVAHPANTVALPVASGSALTLLGTTTTEGYLVSAADGHSISIAGYNQTVGLTTTGVNRDIGVVGPSGSVDISTQLPSTTNSIKTSVSVDAFGFWVATSTGVRYVPFGNSGATASTQVTAAVASPTTTYIASNGQLYADAGAGAVPATGVPALDSPFTVGSGLPAVGGQAITVSSSFPTATDGLGSFPTSNQFAISPDGNTIYIADGRTDSKGGILKYYQVSSNQWSLISHLQLDSFTVVSASETGTTATIVTNGPNNFVVGQTVTIAGVAIGTSTTGGYNASSVTITAVNAGANSFSYAAAAGLAAGSGGFATSTDGGLRALSADFSGANPVFYATTTLASKNRIVKLTDSGDLNGDSGAGFTYTTLATAPTNEAYRGVTLAPVAPGTTASTTALDVGGGSGTYGTGVTLTATVPADATGWVSFRQGGVEIGAAPIVGGTAAFVTAGNLGAGTYSVIAVYTGDSQYAPSTSTGHSVTISKSDTSNALTTSTSAVATGSSVVLTATITVPVGTIPGGTVSFFDGLTLLNTTAAAVTQVIVANVPTFVATFTTSFAVTGSHSLTAVYSGDSNFNASIGGPTTVSVVTPSTTVVTTSNANLASSGDSVTLTATVSGTAGLATGSVQFYDDQLAIGSPVTLDGSGVATVNLATALLQASGSLTPGLHSISAIYTPDSSSATIYAASTGVYEQKVQTQAFASDSQFIYRVGDGSSPLTVNAVASPVTIYVDEYSPAGTLIQSIILPSADGTGSQSAIHGIVSPGQQSATGQMTLSGDGKYLFLVGYDLNPLVSPGISVTATNTVPRVVARIRYDGLVETMAFTTGSNGVLTTGLINGVYSPDGNKFYVSGAGGAVVYFSSFAPSSTLVAGTATISSPSFTVTGLEANGGNLAYLGNTANLISQYVGFPPTAATAAGLPGVSQTTDPNQSFVIDVYFTHLSGNGAPAGINTFYLSDDGPSFANGQITKWSLIGGTWMLTDSITAGTGNAAKSFYWLNGVTNASGQVTLYSTYGNGGNAVTGPGELYAVTDTNGFNAPIGVPVSGVPTHSDALTVVATVGSSSLEVFRGVASTPTLSATPTSTTLAATPNASTGGTLVTFTATVAPSPGAAGTVTFFDNGTAISGAVPVAAGVASFQISTLTIGTHPITAVYSGDVPSGFAGSTSNPLSYVVSLNSTSTTLSVGTPNPATTAQSISFTVTVAGGVSTNGETVVLEDASNGNAVVPTTGGPLAGGTATLTVAAGALTVGTHNLFAVYSGNAFNAGSQSTQVSQTITSLAVPPTLSGVLVNGGSAYAAFAGAQRSDVVSMQLIFSQAVTLDAGAIGMAVHANNQNAGAIPTFAQTSPDGGLTWIISFTGANTDPTFTDPTGALFGPGAPANGFRSLADGVYDFTVNLANIHLVSNPSVAGSGASTTVVSRLFGNADTTGEVSGANHTATVNTADNLIFRGAFNTPANYSPYFDFNGDGQINTTDNLQFRNRFNHPLSWTE